MEIEQHIALHTQNSQRDSIGMHTVAVFTGETARKRQRPVPSKGLNCIFTGRVRLAHQTPATVNVHHLTAVQSPPIFFA
jgi:hypothetical protein